MLKNILSTFRRIQSWFTSALIVGFVSCSNPAEMDDNQKPDINRFTTSVLTQPNDFDEPMAFTFLNNNEILIVERKGGIKHFNIKNQYVQKVGEISVNTFYTNKEGRSRPAEEGLIGVTADPNYMTNNWVYLLFADPDEPKHVLARYELKKGILYEDTKTVVLEYPVQREECCHTGGGMTWDNKGNLFITTGNNTVNPRAGTSNLDERPGQKNNDDQRTGGNTNDLRGKILRIHPEADGSYTIAAGNLFPPGTDKTRPEIYTMGHRNPWRVSWDSETGYIYWGEVGPDASDESERGPRGYDEFNQAKGPGFFGWPYFIGDNIPYADYDHETDSVGSLFDVNNPLNESVNNTGLTKLPPPQPAMLWYPYSFSEKFPLMGSAGRSATGGPVFRKADFPESEKRFPSYYEGKWLIVEFMRGWIMAVTMDQNGDFVEMEPFLPNEKFISAIDMQFSPDGDLYVLEYGSAWFQGNDNALIKRVRYNGGNREPVVKASVDKSAGDVPLVVNFSSEGTLDYDNDKLNYSWSITSDNGFNQMIEEPATSLTLSEPGLYKVQLKVTDEAGNSNQQSLEVLAGNEPPVVDLGISEGNQSFFFAGNEIKYAISVTDKEDGNSADGTIAKADIAINFDYAPEGFDPIEIAQNHVSTDEWISFSRGKTLIEESDCFSCHKLDVKSIGPSYIDVAKRYKNDPEGQAGLGAKIINGGVGVWGEHGMSAHPDITEEQAAQIVDYIMGLNDPQLGPKVIPLSGAFTTNIPSKHNDKGSYLLRVAYADKGSKGLPSITSEKIIALRNPFINAENYDMAKGTELLTTPGRSFYIAEHLGYVGFNQIDMTGIKEIIVMAENPTRVDGAGGEIEIHIDSPDGPLLATTGAIEPVEIDFRAELQRLVAEWEAGGQKGPRPNFRTVRAMSQPKFPLPIENVSGNHDLYFVGKNPNASPGQMLLQVRGFQFSN
ncbi:MAG: PQQ-dependent sugar dehydrogenase [Cyclobacteriaceae bacterium]